MTGLREAAQQALEAIDWMRLHLQRDHQCLHMDPAQSGIPAWINKAEITLRAALAEPVQEPVAWMFVDDTGMRFVSVERPHKDFQPLYATPIQRLPVAKGLPRKLPEDNDE